MDVEAVVLVCVGAVFAVTMAKVIKQLRRVSLFTVASASEGSLTRLCAQ
jgi:hypothetical protein